LYGGTSTFTDGSQAPIYDCIGIGFGPSNIALAVALEEAGLLEGALFLEASDEPAWQPGMLMPGTDIQHHPLRDFVTPRNPCSPYGFLSYLKAHDRLLEFLNLDAPFPPRSEYANYVAWVATKFSSSVRFASPVWRLEPVTDRERGPVARITTQDGAVYHARTISFAPGRSPAIPEVFRPHVGERIVHLDDYQPSLQRWIDAGDLGDVAIIGGSQSAAEIVLDISARLPDLDVTVICRSFGFKLKDVSPFTERIYMPAFVDYFHAAGERGQSEMFEELRRSNYGASDHDVLAALNFRLYEQKVLGREKIQLRFNTQVEAVEPRGAGRYSLAVRDRYSRQADRLDVDAVILATGFRNFGDGPEREPCHPLLAQFARFAQTRADGGVAVGRDFELLYAAESPELPPVFLNGLCESSHGFGDAGSFSLLSVRSERIASALRDRLAAVSIPGLVTTEQRQ
jgi:L-ornithine N5-oxygenase